MERKHIKNTTLFGELPEELRGNEDDNVFKTDSTIEIYADEQFFKDYIVLGCLFVPVSQKEEIIKNLLNLRCLNEDSDEWVWEFEDCPNKRTCKAKWHTLNNTEIHFTELKNATAASKKISRSWLEYLISLNKSGNPLRFNLLYIDLKNLSVEHFGSEKQHENIYNKFFRTCISYGSKSFFDGRPIHIRKVYHDIASVEQHRFFPHLNLKKLEFQNGDEILVEDPNIKFIESDHKKADIMYREECQLIQLIDLILGSASQNILNNATNQNKKEIAMVLRDLIDRLITNPSNVNSSYHYHRRQNISFWPSTKIEYSVIRQIGLDGSAMETKRDLFYRPLGLAMPKYNPNTKTLEDFL